jgi:hypothetical protein
LCVIKVFMNAETSLLYGDATFSYSPIIIFL